MLIEGSLAAVVGLLVWNCLIHHKPKNQKHPNRICSRFNNFFTSKYIYMWFPDTLNTPFARAINWTTVSGWKTMPCWIPFLYTDTTVHLPYPYHINPHCPLLWHYARLGDIPSSLPSSLSSTSPSSSLWWTWFIYLWRALTASGIMEGK